MIIYHNFKEPVQPQKKDIQKEIEVALKHGIEHLTQIDQIMGGIPFEDAVAMGLIDK